MTREELIEKMDEWFSTKLYAHSRMTSAVEAGKADKEAAAIRAEILSAFDALVRTNGELVEATKAKAKDGAK